jgi:hypothetical protein
MPPERYDARGNVSVRQLARLGCAGLALITIATLTSIGLYAIVAGGVLAPGPTTKTTTGGAPVLVTIQAGPSTATPGTTAATEPPTPLPRPATILAPPGAAPAASSGGAPPDGNTTTRVDGNAQAAGARPPGEPSRQATYQGVTIEVVEVARGWQPIGFDGVALAVQPDMDVVTVLVQITNRSNEVRFVSDADVILVGSDGSRYATRPAPLAREPHLLTTPLMAGDVVRGWQTYLLPQGTTITKAQWNPTRADRLPADAAFTLELSR